LAGVVGRAALPWWCGGANRSVPRLGGPSAGSADLQAAAWLGRECNLTMLGWELIGGLKMMVERENDGWE